MGFITTKRNICMNYFQSKYNLSLTHLSTSSHSLPAFSNFIQLPVAVSLLIYNYFPCRIYIQCRIAYSFAIRASNSRFNITNQCTRK